MCTNSYSNTYFQSPVAYSVTKYSQNSNTTTSLNLWNDEMHKNKLIYLHMYRSHLQWWKNVAADNQLTAQNFISVLHLTSGQNLSDFWRQKIQNN